MLGPNCARTPIDQGLRVVIAGPRNDRLNRPKEIAVWWSPPEPECRHARRASSIDTHEANRFLATFPFRLGTQQVFLRHHLQNRPHVLRHATVHEHERVAELLPRGRADFIRRIDAVVGQAAVHG